MKCILQLDIFSVTKAFLKHNLKIFVIFDFQYSAVMTKYDRNGYHARPRAIIITDKNLYMLNEKDFKLKEKIPFTSLKGIVLSVNLLLEEERFIWLCTWRTCVHCNQ